MKTILAEKPSVARTIASVVGATHRKDGYLEGNGYQVTWAIGHLVGLSMPDAYGFEHWDLKHLPIVPEPFRLKVTDNPGIMKQFQVIKSLFQLSHQIIVATDAGREGELIFRYINQLAAPPEHIPVKRLWISDLTDETIRKGMGDLRPIAEYDRIYFAAKARSEADWLVGINFTQGYTLASGKRKPLSVGRVQTATLRLVVDRFQENQGFVPQPFFVPQIVLQDQAGNFTLSGETKFKDKSAALALLEGVKGTQSPEIVRTDKETKEKPPLPYDLTTIQRTANKVYGYTAQQTLDLVQALYEKHRAVTYPRTESQYLATSQVQEVHQIFEGLSNFQFDGVATDGLKSECLGLVPKNKVFNDNKITDHHAIIPTRTQIDLSTLEERECNIYLMIVKRFFQCFLPDCTKANRKLETTLKNELFTASTTQITDKGWRVLSPQEKDVTVLPTIGVGERREIVDCSVHEGVTKPKPLFTESSLLGIMETAGQLVNDKELREGLKERGLGTPATRAATIETLIKREYMVREKSKLVPTELGVGLIDSLRNLSVCSPELTGEWEHRLKLVERNQLDYDSFISAIKSYVREHLPQVLEAAQKVSGIQTTEEVARNLSFGTCPKCQNGEIRKGKKSFYCSNWNQNPKCDFTLWLTQFGKKLTDAQAKSLLNKGTTPKLKGLKGKSKKAFEAKLILGDDFKITLDFN